MKRTQIYLEEEQYEYLLTESRNRGKIIAEIIRELIDNNIATERKKLTNKSFWNIGEDGFSSGISDGSVSHDNVIYGSEPPKDE